MKNYLTKLTNYAMMGVLLLLVLVIFTMILVLLMGNQLMASPYPWLWGAMHFLVVGIGIYFIGRKLYHVLILPPADVEVPEFMARFVGGLRGMLLAGVLVLAAALTLLIVYPQFFFMPYGRKILGGVLGATFFLGTLFPARMVARRTRLWLLLALLGSFFVYKMIAQVALFVPIRFKYEVAENVSRSSMPLLDQENFIAIVPPGAKDFNISGVRGLAQDIAWHCKVSEKDFAEFILARKYKFYDTKDPDLIVCRHEKFFMWYRKSAGRFYGKSILKAEKK